MTRKYGYKLAALRGALLAMVPEDASLNGSLLGANNGQIYGQAIRTLLSKQSQH